MDPLTLAYLSNPISWISSACCTHSGPQSESPTEKMPFLFCATSLGFLRQLQWTVPKGCWGLTSNTHPYYSPLFCPRVFLKHPRWKLLWGEVIPGHPMASGNGSWLINAAGSCLWRAWGIFCMVAQWSPRGMAPAVHSGNQSTMSSLLAFPSCLSPSPSLLLPGIISWLKCLYRVLVSVPALPLWSPH